MLNTEGMIGEQSRFKSPFYTKQWKAKGKQSDHGSHKF